MFAGVRKVVGVVAIVFSVQKPPAQVFHQHEDNKDTGHRESDFHGGPAIGRSRQKFKETLNKFRVSVGQGWPTAPQTLSD